MKSPLVYASQCLSDMEDRWIPYSALWWRIWTPRIPVGDRYQEGAFTGYVGDDDDDTSDMQLLDIRRMLAMPFIRRIYKKLPYIDVVPVKRPYEQMSPEQRQQREAFVIESTQSAYASGKALYPRSTIQRIEDQLTAAGATLARRRKDHHRHPSSKHLLRFLPKLHLREQLFSHTEAPQTAFVSFPAYDAVTTHASTWAPGAALSVPGGFSYSDSDNEDNNDNDDDDDRVFRPARSQVEFRTIQELTQPDVENSAEQFVPDSWMAAVGYAAVGVRHRVPLRMMRTFWGEWGEQVGMEGLEGRLVGERGRVLGGEGWSGLVEGVKGVNGGEGNGVGGGDGSGKEEGKRVLGGVDKIVFFYGNGLSDECDYCKRAMFMFAVAVCLRDLVLELGGDPGRKVPIYMPTVDSIRRWNTTEKTFLRSNGVEFVESNGELFLKVDERTAVLSYRNWNPVKQVVADIARPAVLVCRSVSDDPEQDFAWKEVEQEDGETVRVPKVRARFLEPSSMAVDPDSPRVRKLVRDYDKYELPELPGETEAKEDFSLYLRKADASTEAEYW
jgi:hypothetical protein